METKTLTLGVGSLIRILGPALSFVSASEAADQNCPARQHLSATQHVGDREDLRPSIDNLEEHSNPLSENLEWNNEESGEHVRGTPGSNRVLYVNGNSSELIPISGADGLDLLAYYLLESHSPIRQEVRTLDIFGGTHVEVLDMPLTLEFLEQEVDLALHHSSQNERQRIHELFEAKRNELSKKKACLKWLLDDYRRLKLEQLARDKLC